MLRSKRGCLSGLLVLLGLALILYLSREWWLKAIGHALIDSQSPEQADAVVVLAGDGSLSRLLKGDQLVREGFAPVLIVSGPAGMFGQYECELSIAAAGRRGIPTDKMVCLTHKARSTVEEVRALAPEIRRRGFHKILLVTSNYHTRRSARVWRTESGGIPARVVASTDPDFDPDTWWKSREGQKVAFFEYAKTVAYAIGL